jgi:hypothetical protein
MLDQDFDGAETNAPENLIDPIFAYTDNHPQRCGCDRSPPKAENRRRWTDGLIQDCDWLPIWIEPDCSIRGLIDYKPNRFAKRGDPFRKAIEHLPQETHRSLSRGQGRCGGVSRRR